MDTLKMDTIKTEIRAFISKNFLFGGNEGLGDDTSFLEEGIIDSTGVLELVAHLQEHYGITVEDSELTPDNLDSINSISEFIGRKQQVSPEPTIAG